MLRPDWSATVRPSPLLGDVSVYALSAAFAGWLAATTDLVTFATWAGTAAPGYGLAAGLSLWLLVRGVSGPALHRARARALLLTVVGAVAVPLVVNVHARAGGAAEHANSEVAVIETAAAALLGGQDPYATALGGSEVAGRASGIAEHLPYLPGMLLVGVPRALLPHTAWTDARVVNVLLILALAALVARTRSVAGNPRSRVGLLLIVCPAVALPLTAGGHDLLVVAACLAGFAVLRHGHPTAGAWLVVGAALAKPLAWPAALAYGAALVLRGERRMATALLAIPVAVTTLVWLLSPHAVEDMLLYPLQLTAARPPINGTTAGSVVLAAGLLPADGPTAVAVRVALLGAGLLAGLLLGEMALHRLPRQVAERLRDQARRAAWRTASMSAGLIALAPVARPGYLLYPLSAAVWALLPGRLDAPERTDVVAADTTPS